MDSPDNTGDKGAAEPRPANPGNADFSDVQGGGSSTARTPDDVQRTYVVKQGDSLSRIAQREYGDANKWHEIYEANNDIIKNPDLIYPGQKLRLP
jgi:nucleoid-associated protein YgaU